MMKTIARLQQECIKSKTRGKVLGINTVANQWPRQAKGVNTREPACGPAGESIVHDRIRIACGRSKKRVSGKPLNGLETGEFRELNDLVRRGGRVC